MSFIKKAFIAAALVGAVAVGVGLLQQQGDNEPTPSPVPEQPQQPPVTPPVVVTPPPVDDVLSPGLVRAAHSCMDLMTSTGVASNSVPEDVYRDTIMDISRIFAAQGAELIPYHVTSICEASVTGLMVQSFKVKPGECRDATFTFGAVDRNQRFAVELCRDEDKTLRIGDNGTRVAPAP
ncbi:MAG: hypothetical protein KKA05_00820 [Alphaproteobacteria bacterium]|nr:hypothetical protein [Alphaproteobacteria bacterium]